MTAQQERIAAIAAAAKEKTDQFIARMDEKYGVPSPQPAPAKGEGEEADARWAEKVREFVALWEGDPFSPHDLFTSLGVATSLRGDSFARQKLFNALNN